MGEGGISLDAYKELKLLWKCEKKVGGRLGGGGGGGGGVRMDVNKELKFLWKFKKEFGGGGPVRGLGGCVWRIEVIVKMPKKCKKSGWGGLVGGTKGLVGGKVGGSGWLQYWGCKPRIEGIVKCT